MNRPNHKDLLGHVLLVLILFAGAISYQSYKNAAPAIDYAGVVPE